MGVRIASSGNSTIQNATIGGNANTVALLTGAIGLAQDNAQVLIQWFLLITLGAGITGVNTKLLRGTTISGTLVNQNQPQTVTAATNVLISGCYVDTPGVVGLAQYNITLNPTGAAANSTLLDGCIIALVL